MLAFLSLGRGEEGCSSGCGSVGCWIRYRLHPAGGLPVDRARGSRVDRACPGVRKTFCLVGNGCFQCERKWFDLLRFIFLN